MNSASNHHALPRFMLGRVFVTPAALDALDGAAIPAILLLMRHVCGDWGDVCEADRQQNELALKSGARLLSSYTIKVDQHVWIITEADRSITTVLMPDDY